MIRYFREGLKLSIRAEIDKRGRELDSFGELVNKAKDAEARAALRPHAYARDTDQYYLRRNQPEPEKAKTESWKDPRVEECKPRT